MNKSIRIIVSAIIATIFCVTSCKKVEQTQSVYSFRCKVNDQFVVTGANNWYVNFWSGIEDENCFKVFVPCLYVKPVVGTQEVDNGTSKVFLQYPVTSIIIEVINPSGSVFKKGTNTYKVGESDVQVRVSLGGPYFYSIKMESGYVKLCFLDDFKAKPKFNASFDLDFLVRVKTSSNGETIDTFPLKLTDGVMSYKPM